MKQVRRIASAAAIAVAATASMSASAQEISDQWQYRATIYGWLPDVGGKTTFPAGTGSGISVDASTIIDSLKFVVMGSFEVQKGRWGAFTDIIYLDLGNSRSQTRNLSIGGVELPAGVTAEASLDLKSTVWTLGGSYRVVAEPAATLDVLGGARLLDIKQKLNWQFSADVGGLQPPPRDGSSEVSFSNWDAIIGVKGRIAFGANREWFVPYYLDVGTGDSDLTWQGVVGLGYAFHWGEVFAVWRYLDYDFKSSSRIEDVNFSGPALGVAFRW
jgi:hypothetical protein